MSDEFGRRDILRQGDSVMLDATVIKEEYREKRESWRKKPAQTSPYWNAGWMKKK
jgi:predicted kinase